MSLGLVFWRHVSFEAAFPCWVWTGCVNNWGYGTLSNGRLAHRMTFTEFVGVIPSGMVVCHRCDNPACIRPSHLFLGTQGDNMRDMWAKGRANRRMRTPESCVNGHPDTPANTYLDRLGKKFCRRCNVEARRRYLNRKAATL